MTGWEHSAMRVGDRERRQVLKALARHHARGRIDDAELAERSDAVRTARTLGDLQAVLADLGWTRRPTVPYEAYPRPYRRGPLPFPLFPLLVVAVVLAATGTIPWVAVAIGAAVLVVLGSWRRRRWAGHRWGGPGWAC